MVGKILTAKDVDVTLREFIASTVRTLVVLMFVVIAIQQLGINITPLIAAIGGLAVGLLSFAGLAIGIFALGGGALGIVASGGGAIAWQAAFNRDSLVY